MKLRPMPASRKALKQLAGKKNQVQGVRYLKGPYKGAKPGIGKKHYPNVPVDQQLGRRPSPQGNIY